MSGPAGEPELPRTWRPRRTRTVCYGISVVVVVVFTGVGVALPSSGGFVFTLGDRLALIACAAPICWFLHRHASVRVVATDAGLEVVNLFRRRSLLWGEVLAVRLHRGDPWAYIDLSDGETMACMGIQASDGPAAPAAARELAALVASRPGLAS